MSTSQGTGKGRRPRPRNEEFVHDEFSRDGTATRESEWVPLILSAPEEIRKIHAQSPAAKSIQGMDEIRDDFNIARSEFINAYYAFLRSQEASSPALQKSPNDVPELAPYVETYVDVRTALLDQLIAQKPEPAPDAGEPHTKWKKWRDQVVNAYTVDDETRIETLRTIALANPLSAVTAEQLPEDTETSAPMTPTTSTTTASAESALSRAKTKESEGSVFEQELRDAKERYLAILDTPEKWSGKHNALRKEFTEKFATFLHAEVLREQTEARIELGAEFEKNPQYQENIKRIFDAQVEQLQNEIGAKDPSFDAAASILGDRFLLETFETQLDTRTSLTASIFDGVREPVLAEIEYALTEETWREFYDARIDYFTALNAQAGGYPLPDTNVRISRYRDIRERVGVELRLLEKKIPPEERKEFKRIYDIKKHDALVERDIAYYWLTTPKQSRVQPTGKTLQEKPKGRWKRRALALVSFFIGATAVMPDSPDVPQPPRFEDAQRGPARGTEGSERRSGAVIVQAQRAGAIETFKTLFAQIPEARRTALLEGLHINPEISAEDQAYFVAKTLGFVADTTTETTGTSGEVLGNGAFGYEPRVYSDSYFVLDEHGLSVVRGNETQLLVGADNKKLAEYHD